MTTNSECCAYCQQSSILPVRSSWARAVLTKVESDQQLENIDRRTWYRLIRSDLLKEEYRKHFHELHEDEATTAFLEKSQEKSDNLPVQLLHSIASTVLTVFIARTSGILFYLKNKYINLFFS